MVHVPKPIPDFCWEGRLAYTILLLLMLFFFSSLRVKAVKGITYAKLSPRGLSDIFILLVTILCTVYTCLVIWNYTTWFRLRGLQQLSAREQDDSLLALLKDMIPDNRKNVSFIMRMILVTVLWLVKCSFVVIYYEFCQQLPRATRFFLYSMTFTLIASYVGVWAATASDLQKTLELASYAPAAGAGITTFIPVNTWSTYIPPPRNLRGISPQVSSLLAAELVITSLNAVTDLLLLVLVYFVFRHLTLATGRSQYRSAALLIGLAVLAIIIGLFRLGVLLANMASIEYRLAFDTLTDIEAFIAGCAACVPAMRVLVRGDGSSRRTFAFSLGSSRTSSTSQLRKGSLAYSGGSVSLPASRGSGHDQWSKTLDEEKCLKGTLVAGRGENGMVTKFAEVPLIGATNIGVAK